jgi:hypothetical protein
MRPDPQIVTRTLAEKPTEPAQKILNGTEGQLRALVSTEFRPGAAEALGEGCNGRVLGLINSDTEPWDTADFLTALER